MDVLVVGHVCLDIIPTLAGEVSFRPGDLVEAGPAILSPGGAVSNVGITLSRLGVATGMMGKLGRDAFGSTLKGLWKESAPNATQSIQYDGEIGTSYTIVLNLTGQDRMFLHSPGSNRTFTSSDVPVQDLKGARLMHFGYPPLMESFYEDGGKELVALFRRAKESGILTSLDLSLPDPNSPSGRADWRSILRAVLPYVDYFLPSLDELLFMLDRPKYDTFSGEVEENLVRGLCKTASDFGAKNVGLKLGESGLYYRSEGGEEFWQSCFPVEVAGTTGSGDATIAGFLSGTLRGLPVAETLKLACAAGACCCSRPDAISGVQNLKQVEQMAGRPSIQPA